MDPVARVRDVLDIGVGEQPLDFWVIVRAETQGEETVISFNWTSVTRASQGLLQKPDKRFT